MFQERQINHLKAQVKILQADIRCFGTTLAVTVVTDVDGTQYYTQAAPGNPSSKVAVIDPRCLS